MSYHVLARKWRPQTFSDLVGQNHVVKALNYALSNQQIHHAYLFTGTRGVGKTSIARIFAKSLNCETHGVSANPCGECESCIEIKAGKFVDLIEVDAASRTGVDETRELIESVAYLPSKGRYKVYLIDEVHMFSKSSFNALLKTLEEPPEHVKFILATTDPEKLPITILSRCLQFNLKSLTPAQIRQHLMNICHSESIQYDEQALGLIASAGDGSMRDTLSIMDQAIAYGQGQLQLSTVTEILGTIQPNDIEAILFAIATNNPNQLKQALQQLDNYEVDARAFLIEIMRRLQQMTWAKEGIIDSLSPSLQSTVNDIPKALLHLWYDIAEKALPNLSIAGEPRQAVEMVLLRMLAFIPDDWVTRHRTMLEVPAQEPQEEHSNQNVTTANNADTMGCAEAIHASPVTTQDSLEAAEEQFSEHTPDPIVSPQEPSHSQSANVDIQQPDVEQTIQAATTDNLGLNQGTDNTASNTVTSDIQAPAPEVTSAQSHNEQPQSWGLSSDIDNAPPPSMDEVMQMMQSGRDISPPTDNALELTPPPETAMESVPPWEEAPLMAAPTSTAYENGAQDTEPFDATEQQPTYQEPLDAIVPAVEQSAPIQEHVSALIPENEVPTEEQDTPLQEPALTAQQPHSEADLENFDWYTTLHELGLSDYSHHFASLGILRLEKQEHYLQATLDLPPKHELLITEESIEELKQALENRFSTPINLETHLTSLTTETPSERDKLASDKRQADLIDTFRQEPITQQVLDMFNSTIIEKTVSPVTRPE